MQWRAKDLPTKQQEENEQHHGVPGKGYRTANVTEMRRDAEDNPYEHQNPVAKP